MTPEALARIHAASFTAPRPWSEKEFSALLNDPACDLITRDGGFALIRTIVSETELLTLAVDPDHRRKGIGQAILSQAIDLARGRESDQFFLEVAANNAPAIALYERLGFARIGLRRNYYRKPDGARIDALLFALPLQTSTG